MIGEQTPKDLLKEALLHAVAQLDDGACCRVCGGPGDSEPMLVDDPERFLHIWETMGAHEIPDGMCLRTTAPRPHRHAQKGGGDVRSRSR